MTLISFRWNGRTIEGVSGDTIAAALWRHGISTLGASRKRHRPLGASGAYLQGVLVSVDGEPHVRADQRLISPALDVREQNVWPSADFNLLRLLRLIPARWTRGGFEYPRSLPSGTRRFELWERLLMFLAGEVSVSPETPAPSPPLQGKRWDGDVVVVGGGPEGRRQANAAVTSGARTCLISRSVQPGAFAARLRVDLPALDPRVELLGGHEAVGIYRRGTVILAAPLDPNAPAVVLVCMRLMLAIGRRSIPPLVPGQDLPGVMDARLALEWASSGLGAQLGPAVVVGSGAQLEVADALAAHGVSVAAVEPVQSLTRIKGDTSVRAAVIGERAIGCRTVVHAGPWVRDPALPFQACAAGSLRLVAGASLPDNVTVVGSAAVADDPIPVPPLESIKTVAVCPCMDVTVHEILMHIDKGRTHVEVLKRATSCGMGPCQGFPCWERMRAVLNSATGDASSNDHPTYRPPRRGLTVAQAAALDGLLELE